MVRWHLARSEYADAVDPEGCSIRSEWSVRSEYSLPRSGFAVGLDRAPRRVGELDLEREKGVDVDLSRNMEERGLDGGLSAGGKVVARGTVLGLLEDLPPLDFWLEMVHQGRIRSKRSLTGRMAEEGIRLRYSGQKYRRSRCASGHRSELRTWT